MNQARAHAIVAPMMKSLRASLDDPDLLITLVVRQKATSGALVITDDPSREEVVAGLDRVGWPAPSPVPVSPSEMDRLIDLLLGARP